MMTVKPFGWRLSVVESIIDEKETESGIVVPLTFGNNSSDGSPTIRRGMVVAIGLPDESEREYWEDIGQGTIVYYRRATQIDDVWIVSAEDIIAYED